MQKTEEVAQEPYGASQYQVPSHPEKPTRTNSDVDLHGSDTTSVDTEALTGVSKVEAAQAVWNGKMRWVLFFG